MFTGKPDKTIIGLPVNYQVVEEQLPAKSCALRVVFIFVKIAFYQ